MKNLLTILLLFLVHFVNGQSGSIELNLENEENKALSFVRIEVQKNNCTVALKDFVEMKNMNINILEAGTYDIAIHSIGYSTRTITHVEITDYERQEINLKINHDVCLEIIRIPHKQQLVNPWNVTQGTTFSSDEIRRSPHKN